MGTLEEGVEHVDREANLAQIEAEELRIQQELQETIMSNKTCPCTHLQLYIPDCGM